MRTAHVSTLLAAALVAALLPACGPDVVPPPTIEIPAFEPPLHDTAVGEQLVTRRGSEEWRYTVVSAGDLQVVVEVVKYVEGAPQGRPQRFQWHRNGFGLPENAVVRKLEPGRIEVGGRPWKCWILHVATRSAGRFYYWVSADVGVHGILKIARNEGGAPDEAHAITWVSDSLSSQ